MDPSLRALNRFGLGARPGERRRLRDPRGWLDGQLDGPPPTLDDADLPARGEAARAFAELRALQRGADDAAQRRAREALRDLALKEASAALGARVVSQRPFVERLVAFFSNHLCVSTAGRAAVVPFAGPYEREVIRPHVLGRYEDMVLASARHPAMLLYLDNAQSIGPGSPAGRRSGRRGREARGLNENYARELLELHTLGVDGGYGQDDVEALARILTGWTVEGVGPRAGGAEPRFVFRGVMHEPGPKTLLGVRYAQGGEAEGEAAIRALCRHPSTARFLATKLARHFVADDPPPAAVEALTSAWRSSGGDLRAVARALVRLDAAWEPEHRKLRTPQDWLVAVLRALDAPEAPDALAPVLVQLRQPLWAPPAPKGYGDSRREWGDPDALMNRAELARSLSRRAARPGIDPTFLADVVDVAADDPLPTLLADESIPAGERVALALAGPAFQWR